MTFAVSFLQCNHSDTFILVRRDAVYVTYAPNHYQDPLETHILLEQTFETAHSK